MTKLDLNIFLNTFLKCFGNVALELNNIEKNHFRALA